MRRGGASARRLTRAARTVDPGRSIVPAPTTPALPEATPGTVLLIACGALAREVLALRQLNAWDCLALTCLPASLHNTPEAIPEAVRARIRAARAAGHTSIFVLFADCGTGGMLDQVCTDEGVERIAGAHCYAFFDGVERFAARAEAGEIGAFYLTDFLARQFDTLVWRGLGLDRYPDLLPVLFGGYDKLIHLAQTEDPALEHAAQVAATRLGLTFERRFTGYGALEGFMARATRDTSEAHHNI
ncbi:MAG: DUF1638 domain-containing protein [Pseudomonadota bacterium]